MDNRPIGVFDSGIGGLSVVKEIMRELPNESIIYFGDTARVPYGPKSPEAIRRFSIEILNFLLKKDVKAIVIACNTASAVALELLQTVSPIPVYGVIDAGAISAVKKTKNAKIGIIGTKTTIRTNAHAKVIQRLNPDVESYSIPCPLFVPLIEEGWNDSAITSQIIKRYLDPLKNNIDTIILGCTHYPLMQGRIKKFLGPKVNIVCPASELAKEIKKDLTEKSEASSMQARYRFFVSDIPEDFASASSNFIKLKPEHIEKVVLDEITAEEINIKISPIQHLI
jgi:glutamate racemase